MNTRKWNYGLPEMVRAVSVIYGENYVEDDDVGSSMRHGFRSAAIVWARMGCESVALTALR